MTGAVSVAETETLDAEHVKVVVTDEGVTVRDAARLRVAVRVAEDEGSWERDAVSVSVRCTVRERVGAKVTDREGVAETEGLAAQERLGLGLAVRVDTECVRGEGLGEGLGEQLHDGGLGLQDVAGVRDVDWVREGVGVGEPEAVGLRAVVRVGLAVRPRLRVYVGVPVGGEAVRERVLETERGKVAEGLQAGLGVPLQVHDAVRWRDALRDPVQGVWEDRTAGIIST